jgi:hypothetical protein
MIIGKLEQKGMLLCIEVEVQAQALRNKVTGGLLSHRNSWRCSRTGRRRQIVERHKIGRFKSNIKRCHVQSLLDNVGEGNSDVGSIE